MIGRQESVDQIRRILLVAVARGKKPGKTTQLELPLWGLLEPVPSETFLDERSDLAHSLLLELVVLIQMELSGLVASPLTQQVRRRMGLGSDPPLRFLAEWESIPPLEYDPWQLGAPSIGREQAYADGMGRVRALAEAGAIPPSQVREMARRAYVLTSHCAPQDDLPGQIVAHGARHRLRLTPAGRLGFQGDRGLGRGNGVVHTPPFLAAELTEILMRACAAKDSIDGLDPACGSGLFLLSLAHHLAGRSIGGAESSSQCGDRLSRLRQLHGVDLDPRSCRVAAWNLSYWAAREAQTALSDPPVASLGSFLDELFGQSFPYFLGTQIQTGNALHIEPSTFSPGFIWESRFPRIFSRPNPGFDLIMGNPPWISYGLRSRASAPEEERLYYERLYPAGTQYKLTIYPLFMELALRLCREGGIHGFLVPDSILTGHHFSRIRRFLLTEADLFELTLIESGLWSGVTSGHTVLYAVRKKSPHDSGDAPLNVLNRFLRVGRGRAKQVWSSMAEERRPYTESTQVSVPAVNYSPSGTAALHVYRDEGQMSFLSRVQSCPLRLRDVVWTYSGLIARYGQKSIQSDEPRADFTLRDAHGRVVFDDPHASDRWHPAMVSGGEIVPYLIKWRGGRVYMPEAKEDLGRVYKSGFDLSRYSEPKIFLRQTGDRLIAALDRGGYYCLNNLHLIGSGGPAHIPPLLLTGILMSNAIQRTYRLLSQEGSRPLAQVDLKTLESLPYPSDANGVPVGSGPTPPRAHREARRVLRTLEKVVHGGDPSIILEMAADAWRVGPAPFAKSTLSGSEVMTVILLRLVELREEEARDAPAPNANSKPSVLQWVLDQICEVLFQVVGA